MSIHASIPAWFALLLGLLWPGSSSADLVGHGGPVKAIIVSTDGLTAATAGFDYAVIVWDLPVPRQRFRLDGHAGPVNALAWLHGEERLVSVGDDGAAILWDLRTGTALHRFEAGAKLAAVAVAPDGTELAAAGWDGKAHRWRLADGQSLPHLHNGQERLNAIAYAPDGRTITAGGHAGSLGRWRASDGVRLETLPAHDFGITALTRLGDGRLVSASIDRRVRLWTDGDPAPLTLDAHEQPVTALAVSADGRQLASGGIGGQIILWSLADSRPERVLDTRPQPIWALAFTPDGQGLLIGGADGTVRAWDRRTASPITVAAAPPSAGDDPRGAGLLAKCTACHSLAPDGPPKAGPTLHGIFGRRAGSVAGYPYSPALRASSVVWTEATIARLFEVGPDEFVPGSKMPLQRLREPRDRADLIGYLKRVTAPAAPGPVQPEVQPR